MILESRPLHKKKKRLAKNKSRDSSRDSSQSVSAGLGVQVLTTPVCSMQDLFTALCMASGQSIHSTLKQEPS